MQSMSRSSSYSSNGSGSPPSSSSSPPSGSGPSQPSARFLYNQAAHSFLLRQHSSTLDILETLFRQLPPPKHEWTLGAWREGREREREEVRRKAVILWITCLACIYTDKRRDIAVDSLPNVRASQHAHSRAEDALVVDGGPDELYRSLVDRSADLYRPASTSSRTLPPTIALTLVLTSIKLGLPSSHPRDLVVLPFVSSLPASLSSLLAAQSRQRETREGSLERLRGSEGWPGEMLDGYEKVVEGWCVTVLGQYEGKIREASDLVGEDRVLGRAKKEELLQTLSHLPPRTPSPPANISLLPLPTAHSTLPPPAHHLLPPRPSSPALSEAGSESSIATATPNNFRGGKAKDPSRTRSINGGPRPEESSTLVQENTGSSYAAFTDRLRRFVVRPTESTASTATTSSTTRVNDSLLVALRTRLSALRLPASVLLFLILALMGVRRWWVRRGRGAAGSGAGAATRDVRSRLGRGILARLLG